MIYLLWLLFGMILGAILELFIIVLVVLDEVRKEEEELYKNCYYNNKVEESFTYDCLNDPDPDDTDIPKLY